MDGPIPKQENQGAAALIQRMAEARFTGKIELHCADGQVGAVHVIERFPRETLRQLAQEWVSPCISKAALKP